MIRAAKTEDLERIAEIEIFNYRLFFYPIFQNDDFYFQELTVSGRAAQLQDKIGSLWVYDDGVVKGFVMAAEGEIQKLYVEPVLQGAGIGAALLEYAVAETGTKYLWALEKNVRAIRFYQRHGFVVTKDRKPEEDTEEYLVRLTNRGE